MSGAIAALPEWCRERAEQVRRFSPAAAEAFAEAAEEADRRLANWLLEPLDVPAAADESGYTRQHLRRLLREGTVPNAGTSDDPRILRRDLPRKPGHGVANTRRTGAISRLQVARAVANGD